MTFSTITRETTRAQVGGEVCAAACERYGVVFCERFRAQFFATIEAMPSVIFHPRQPSLLSMVSLASRFSRPSYGVVSAVSLFLGAFLTPALHLQAYKFLAALTFAPSFYYFSTTIFFITLANWAFFFWIIKFFPSCKDTLLMTSVISPRTDAPLFTEGVHAY